MAIGLLSASSTTSANVFLNSTDYGSNFQGAMNAATTPGDIIEFRDNNTYEVPSSWTDPRFGTPNVTLRSAAGYKATVESTSGGTNGLFYVSANNVTFENLIIKNNPAYGTYAFWFDGTKDAANNYPSKGMTVRNVEFYDTRGVICAGSGWVTDLTFVDNLVNNADYGLGKTGMNYGNGNTIITGNTFINNGTMGDKTEPREAAIWIESNIGHLLIDDNIFQYNYNAEGQYAIYSNADLSAHPITLGNNDFGTGLGGSGAAYQVYPLPGGGYAVGLANAASVIPEPGTLVLLAAAGLGALAFAWRRRRT